MAHILKYPTASCKGIILFTHKEVGFFSAQKKQIRYEAVNKLTNTFFPQTKYKSYYQNKLHELHQSYYFGEHFGWYHRDYPAMPMIDFYLATESTVTFQEESAIFRVPLSSSSFIDPAFKRKNLTKVWDIISVSHSGKNKRLDAFLKSIRKLYDKGKYYKVLLVCKAGINETTKRHYVALEDDYHRMFSEKEQQYFTLLRINPTLSFLGLPAETIADFYNLSKVFTLFSQQEGEPRAASEALLCGLPVVMNKHIKAGGVGLDNLNEANSVLFTAYEEAHLALEQAVERYQEFTINSEGLAKLLREDYTVEQLKQYMAQLYEQDGNKFDYQLDNAQFLSKAVNAHLTNVPWSLDRMQTADIKTKQQFDTFFNTAKSHL